MDVEETRLPGIGLRHDLVTARGRRIGVVSQVNGVRHIVLYDERDPDASVVDLELTPEESDALADLLGAPRITERLSRLREQVAGLATEGIAIEPGSPFVGRTLGDTAIRSRTGASVVAVVRGDDALASPTPDFRFHARDRLIVVGTRPAVLAVQELLARAD